MHDAEMISVLLKGCWLMMRRASLYLMKTNKSK